MGERRRLAVIVAISVTLFAVCAVVYAQAAMHSPTGWGMMSNMMGNSRSIQAQCQSMMDHTDMTECESMMGSNDMSQCANMMGSYDMAQCQAMMQQYNMNGSC